MGYIAGDTEPPLIETSENCDFPVEDNIDDGFTNELLSATPTPAATQEVTPPGGWSQYGKWVWFRGSAPSLVRLYC